MCLILVAWRAVEAYPCVIAANRDESYARPSSPAHWWNDAPQIFAGRDLEGGGTWLGLTRDGRFAALTNYRDPESRRVGVASRGLLVSSILNSHAPIERTLEQLRADSANYNSFNIIFSDGERLGIFESMRNTGRELGPGIYGLSNHLLDTPWPKVQTAKSRMSEALADAAHTDRLLALLRDEVQAPDGLLPRTGVSLEWERLLSSAFVRAAEYGTRCSTLLRVDQQRRAWFDEYGWDRAGAQIGKVEMAFDLERVHLDGHRAD